jgi:hypothetical protein
MPEHKFKIGQVLDFTPDRKSGHARSGKCKVVSLLPAEGDNPQYRIRCTTENFERVVWEGQLR